MATPQNDSSVRLYATVPRNINPTLNNALILIATPSSFQVNSAGSVGTPSLIPLTVSRIGLTGAVTWNVSGATLSTSGDTATLAFSSMLGASATVSVSLVKDGITYTSNVCTITKVSDGAAGTPGTPGTTGTRGAGHFYIVGNPWSDALANSATPGANVIDDVVTVYTSGVYVLEKKWDGTNWVAQGTVVDGNLLVPGTVKTAALDAYAVTASKVNITTSGGALNRDRNFVDYPASWMPAGTLNAGSGPGGSAPANTYIFASSGNSGYAMTTESIPIDATKTYVLSGSVYADGGNNRFCSFVIDFYDASNNHIASSGWGDATFSGIVKQFLPVTGDWYPYKDGKFGAGTSKTFSATAKYCRIGVYLNAGGSSSTLMAVTSLQLEEMIPGVLIKDGAITADKIFVTTLTAITADLGTATISTGGYLRSGQTAYNTGTGFWLGSVSGVPQFSIGNPSGAHMRWDGSNLYIVGETKATFSVAITGSLSSTVANGLVTYGNRTATVTGGVGTLTYQWYVSGTQANDLPANYFASGGTTGTFCTIRGSATNMQIIGQQVVVVTEVATGRTCTATVGHNPTHGTYP